MPSPATPDFDTHAAPDRIGAARAESDAPGVEPSHAAFGEGEGDVIGGYKLLQIIGQGGMGTVWMAQQAAPIQRRVALKIVKLGMDTKEVVARFEAERQALAMMDHPHIAKVLDGGATEHGRPFFAMELVRGTPITHYCDKARLGLRERLELFKQVCGAVQHAHHKGIIHRDIKPSNVMITLYDGVAVPKVIDFGIAKATCGELTRKTLFTRYEQMIGTPDYMAPEQAELSGLDIDTRADVYSLGVLLYELLTGTRPFDIRAAMRIGYDELLRTIREVEPVAPSMRVSTLGDRARTIAANRHEEAGGLARSLRGDLDWIVMKALEKDRSRRYETANGFAMDIGRYLNQEPVVAVPPSAAYRVRKFVQRRKLTVAATGAIALLVVAGSVGTGIGWWRARKANADLDIALVEKTAALGRETLERERAEHNAARALLAEAEAKAEALRVAEAERQARQRADERDQVATFQAERLRQIDPEMMGVRLRRSLLAAGGGERRASLTRDLAGLNFTSISLELLEQSLFAETIVSIDRQFEDQPLVRAQLLQTMGDVLIELGLMGSAMDPTRRALEIRREQLGDDHPDTLGSSATLGVLLGSQGRLEEAEPLFRDAVERGRRVLGDGDPDLLELIGSMGVQLQRQNKLAQAETFLQEALEGYRRVLGDDHPDTLAAIMNFGVLLWTQGKLEEAEPFLREALDGQRRVLGDDHPQTLNCISAMGGLLQHQGRLEEAEPFFREALAGRLRVCGDDHPQTLDVISRLGFLLQTQGKLDEAERYCRESLAAQRRVLGDDHPSTLHSIGSMGALLVRQNRLDEAEPLVRESLEGMRRTLGDDHPDTRHALGALGALLVRLIPQVRAEGRSEQLGFHLAHLGELLLLGGQYVQAEEKLAEGYEILAEQGADTDWRLSAVLSDLGAAVAGQKRYAEAESLLLESGEALMGDGSLSRDQRYLGVELVPTAIQRVVDVYAAWQDVAPGQGHDRQAAEWRDRLAQWEQGQ